MNFKLWWLMCALAFTGPPWPSLPDMQAGWWCGSHHNRLVRESAALDLTVMSQLNANALSDESVTSGVCRLGSRTMLQIIKSSRYWVVLKPGKLLGIGLASQLCAVLNPRPLPDSMADSAQLL